MKGLTPWLDSRRPIPPSDLTDRLRGESLFEADGDVHGHLAGVGRGAMERALARPGRVRASAFDLLLADALMTYACEAALESQEPETALRSLVEVAAGP